MAKSQSSKNSLGKMEKHNHRKQVLALRAFLHFVNTPLDILLAPGSADGLQCPTELHDRLLKLASECVQHIPAYKVLTILTVVRHS